MAYAPEPTKNGKRRYGTGLTVTWEDPARCIMAVARGTRVPHFYQCERKRGQGPGGLYCHQHDPAVVAAREQAASDRYRAQMAADPAHRLARIREQIREEAKLLRQAGLTNAANALEAIAENGGMPEKSA